MKLEKYLKTLRIRNGLTQQEVAAAMGYKTSQFVSNWERRLCGAPEADLGKLAKIFNVNPIEFVDIRCQDFREGLLQKIRANR